MIQYLKLSNVGPAAEMELDFGSRLNLLTGDNGLGKSFLLDIIWWALTRTWPAEMNAQLTAGKIALPTDKRQPAFIEFGFQDASKQLKVRSDFQPRRQNWRVRQGIPQNPGLVFYAMADGGFAVWDPARNYGNAENEDGIDRPAAYVFSPKEVWDGLNRKGNRYLSNGLIRDWANWQNKKGREFELLKAVLHELSPSEGEELVPGELTRISLDDVRDMPTLIMRYSRRSKQDIPVPVVHASSGMRRIIALGYFLVWCWEEHKKAKELLGEDPESKAVMLVDEAESHLHPHWQRSILPALLKVMKQLSLEMEVQLFVSTHSPLLMVSVEPEFNPKTDAWFDIDCESDKVLLRKMEFEKHGAVEGWLTSEAFDLSSCRPREYEALVKRASALLKADKSDDDTIHAVHQELIAALRPTDPFLFRWRALCAKKGWQI
ncbi:MAG: AAA family ATPase [Desulfovibrionaceae bacterium]|nr:AAA family ATPase [Desulfovibrionaceae bacterium]